MTKIGKVKFSLGSQKLDYFRVCSDAKDAKKNWKILEGFPDQLTDMPFYFPFSNMANNITVRYTGYAKLSSDGTPNGPQESYFIQSMGIGEPILARPDGHKGNVYDGRQNKKMILTEERLAKWPMVKKRMQVLLVPKGFAPTHFLVWHTTSLIAFDQLLKEYNDLQTLTGNGDISLLPLHFVATPKQFKNADGKNVKFSFGSIRYKGSLAELVDHIEYSAILREKLNLKQLEEEWERSNVFFVDDEEEGQGDIPKGYTIKVDDISGEVTYVHTLSGEVYVPPAESENKHEELHAYLNADQVEQIVSLAKKHEKQGDLEKVANSASALHLLSKLRTLDLQSA